VIVQRSYCFRWKWWPFDDFWRHNDNMEQSRCKPSQLNGVRNLDPASTVSVALNMVTKSRRKINEVIEEDGVDDILGLTQFSPHESDNSQTMWDVVAILRESGSKYQVQWAGIDPSKGKPWKPTWIPKEDCTDELIQEWKAQKRNRKEAKKSKTNTARGMKYIALLYL
jgi:hypothetical protein